MRHCHTILLVFRIVLAQLEGSGRGALASYNQEQYKALFSHLQEASLSDPHAWLELLMRKDKALGEQQQQQSRHISVARITAAATSKTWFAA
jgi:hypothetical protein